MGAVKKAKAAMELRLKNLSPLAKEILKEMVQVEDFGFNSNDSFF